MRTESAFERATSVAAAGDGRWAATVDEGWFAVRGPNGGYLAAIVLRAITAQLAGRGPGPVRHPRSLTLHYLRPPAAGAMEVEVAVERAGRRLTTASARATQAGELCIVALAALSTDFDGELAYAGQPPRVPAAADVAPVPPESALVSIARRFEIRPALGERPFSESDRALTGGWISFREGEPPADAAALAMLTDAWMPAAFVRTAAPFAAPTIDLTIHFRAPDVTAAWPLLVAFRSTHAHGGFFEEDGEVWSADGRLLAHSRQLALAL